MNDRQWQIGLSGTFDVENFGDLLFPLIAEAELKHRLGDVKLRAFSYHAKTPPDWPYTVTPLTELPEMISRLDGLLIGGGFIIRFDKEVAPGYEPPTGAIHHPTGYWLTPALIALQHGVPVVWNAPGMHCNEIPLWAEPLMEMAFSLSRYTAVRDEPSQSALSRFADDIAVVPDTGFGVARLLDENPSAEFDLLRESVRLTDPYIIIQATLGLDEFARFIKDHAERLRGFRFLALPIGPVLGDTAAIFGDDLPGVVRLSAWPHPLLTAELIKYSEAVIGHSYHLAITALACGVPVFTPQDLSAGKYTALQKFDAIYPLPRNDEPDWFMERVGRKAPSAAARATLDQLARHWDRIADIIRAGRADTKPALNRFWQSLPALLERAEKRINESIAQAEIAMQSGAAHPKSISRKLASMLRFFERKPDKNENGI
ncbi:MAG: polysaccharide pyruvyl transferase family protein [Acidobacteriota bacterium]